MCCFADETLPQISTCREFLPEMRERSEIYWRFFTLFVINPLRSARPTSLLWRLSVSETGIVDRADQSSYHTLRQIAHGLFGGGGWPPFGIQHILQSNSYQPQVVLTNIHVINGELAMKDDIDEAETTYNLSVAEIKTFHLQL